MMVCGTYVWFRGVMRCVIGAIPGDGVEASVRVDFSIIHCDTFCSCPYPCLYNRAGSVALDGLSAFDIDALDC